MDDNIKTLLGEEIESEFNSLASLTPGSEEHTKAVDNLVKLYKLRIDEAKTDMDYREKHDRREMEASQFESDLEHRKAEQQLKRDQLNEQIKEHEDNAVYQEREEQLKRDQMADLVIDRYIKLGAEIAGIILPLAFYAHWMKRGFKFEETGTFTSTTFRGLFNRFKPTGK